MCLPVLSHLENLNVKLQEIESLDKLIFAAKFTVKKLHSPSGDLSHILGSQ